MSKDKRAKLNKMTEVEIIEHIRNTFSYDPDTGHITTKCSKHRTTKVGTVFNSEIKGGYIKVYTLGKGWYAHRVSWLLHYGEWPKETIDHINSVTNDNRIINLRDCSVANNNKNRKPYKGKSFKGAYRRNSRWEVAIVSGGSINHGGSYDCLGVALRKYDDLALELHGDYAKLNFPIDNI